MFKLYKYVLPLVILGISTGAAAKDLEKDDIEYRRSSLYSLLVTHTEQKFSPEITEEYLKLPVPDKYNDMNLSVRVLSVDNKGDYDARIADFLEREQVASRLVAKWFNRDILTGRCDMDLVKERGLYDASEFDKELAARSARGTAMLEDAGEDLIGNTFVLVNEINYIDKGKRSRNWGMALQMLGAVAGAATGIDAVTDLGESLNDMVSTIKGFRVKINTRLYQLVWDEEVANDFYRNYYQAEADPSAAKAFEEARGKFKLKYVGKVSSSGQKSSFLGISEEEPELMIRKACQRALDENVADLQKEYEQFKIKAPIVSVEPDIKVQIGLKEGISEDSKFEVLEAQEKDGRVVYKRVGTVRPVKGKIWDNRFMAVEEQAYGADFGATTFKKESGGDFYPGLLIREIK